MPAGFLMHGREAGPDPASSWHRLLSDPGHRYRGLETSADPLARRQRDRAELQLSYFGQAPCDQRLVLSAQTGQSRSSTTRPPDAPRRRNPSGLAQEPSLTSRLYEWLPAIRGWAFSS